MKDILASITVIVLVTWQSTLAGPRRTPPPPSPTFPPPPSTCPPHLAPSRPSPWPQRIRHPSLVPPLLRRFAPPLPLSLALLPHRPSPWRRACSSTPECL